MEILKNIRNFISAKKSEAEAARVELILENSDNKKHYENAVKYLEKYLQVTDFEIEPEYDYAWGIDTIVFIYTYESKPVKINMDTLSKSYVKFEILKLLETKGYQYIGDGTWSYDYVVINPNGNKEKFTETEIKNLLGVSDIL